MQTLCKQNFRYCRHALRNRTTYLRRCRKAYPLHGYALRFAAPTRMHHKGWASPIALGGADPLLSGLNAPPAFFPLPFLASLLQRPPSGGSGPSALRATPRLCRLRWMMLSLSPLSTAPSGRVGTCVGSGLYGRPQSRGVARSLTAGLRPPRPDVSLGADYAARTDALRPVRRHGRGSPCLLNPALGAGCSSRLRRASALSHSSFFLVAGWRYAWPAPKKMAAAPLRALLALHPCRGCALSLAPAHAGTSKTKILFLHKEYNMIATKKLSACRDAVSNSFKKFFIFTSYPLYFLASFYFRRLAVTGSFAEFISISLALITFAFAALALALLAVAIYAFALYGIFTIHFL